MARQADLSDSKHVFKYVRAQRRNELDQELLWPYLTDFSQVFQSTPQHFSSLYALKGAVLNKTLGS